MHRDVQGLQLWQKREVRLTRGGVGQERHLAAVAPLTHATPRQPNLARLPELEALNIPVHRVGAAKWAREPMSASAGGDAVGVAL